MRVALVAPGAVRPWTEGRKNLVRDLVNLWSAEHDLTLFATPLSGRSASFGLIPHQLQSHPGIQLLRLIADLPALLDQTHPEALVHFPYGSFRKARGLGNLWSIRRVAQICNHLGIPHVTLLYSMDRYVPPGILAMCSRNVVTGSSGRWPNRQIDLGINTSGWPEPHRFSGGRRLLFLAGSTGARRDPLPYILNTRGLGVALRAGDELSCLGADLTLASPMLERDDLDLARRIRDHPQNSWDDGLISFVGSVAVPSVFNDYDYFLFPYVSDIPVFRPTSVMEAMFAGVIPVLSDLPFLRHSVNQDDVALWFRPNDEESLVRVLSQSFVEHSASAHRAEAARDYAERHFSIDVTARDLMQLVRSAR